jgi:hypothetical protein
MGAIEVVDIFYGEYIDRLLMFSGMFGIVLNNCISGCRFSVNVYFEGLIGSTGRRTK